MNIKKINELREWMQNNQVEVAYVSNPSSIAYLTGFESDPHERVLALFIHADKAPFLFTPAMEVPEAKKAFSEEKAKAFCREKGIGIGDTAMEIIRLKNNASDNFLQVVTPLNPVEVLAKIPECEAIVVTGQKAMDTLIATLPPVEEPKVGSYSRFTLSSRIFHLYRMPSSSRAYPKPLEEKAAVYKQMFEDLKMI